jgi:putative heme-binding domain-containing protein
MLENFHGKQDSKAIEIAWPYLEDKDRFIRYAARVAVESQPLTAWKEKALQESNPIRLTQATIALARKGDSSIKGPLLDKLVNIKFQNLEENQQLDLIRAIELVFARMGSSKPSQFAQVGKYLLPYFPAKSSSLNKELAKLLLYTQTPEAVAQTLQLLKRGKEQTEQDQTLTSSADLIFRNPDYGLNIARMLSKRPPLEQTWYAVLLSSATNGWDPEGRKQYFEWYANAYNYKGGFSFNGFINQARANALAHVPKENLDLYKLVSSDSVGKLSRWETELGNIRPKGPGRNWKLEEALKIIDSGLVNRDFERGKGLFASSYCKSCHQMNNEGGVSGPDLTMLGNRFSNKDILEAIISPSKTISDQFGATIFYLRKGGSVMGRIIREDNKNYYVSQNPFAPEVLKEVAKKEVARKTLSATSIMLPGMINGMNPEELKDFMAFLKSGGNSNREYFKK